MKIATHYTFLFTEHNFKFTNSEFVKGVSCIIEINNNLLKIGFLSNQRDGFDLLILKKLCYFLTRKITKKQRKL